jgi:hypothetical protein
MKMNVSTITNFAYIIPIYVSYDVDVFFATILSALFISSLCYHYFRSKFWSSIDTFISFFVLMYAIYSTPTLGMSSFKISLVSFGLIVALVIRYKVEDGTRDDVWHGVWHCLVAFLLTVVVL